MEQPKPSALPVQEGQIPDALKEIPQWVAWGFRWHALRACWTKPPINVRTGRLAISTDPTTGVPFAEALRYARARRLEGVGLILTEALGLVGVDLDDCVVEGEVAPWATRVLQRFQSYSELSPSATGLRVIVRAGLPCRGTTRPPIELYCAERYITLTGHRLPWLPAEPQEGQEAALALLAAAGWTPTLPVTPQAPGLARPPGDLYDQAQARLSSTTLCLLDSVGGASYASASEADSALACALLRAGLSRYEAQALIDAHPRGADAAQRKGSHVTKYWQMTLAKADQLVGRTACGVNIRRDRMGRALAQLRETRD